MRQKLMHKQPVLRIIGLCKVIKYGGPVGPFPGADLHGLTLMHTTQIRLALSLHGTELPKKKLPGTEQNKSTTSGLMITERGSDYLIIQFLFFFNQ